MNIGEGHYGVRVSIGEKTVVHHVYAKSDYAAAIAVRNATGYMAMSEEDVLPLGMLSAQDEIVAERTELH